MRASPTLVLALLALLALALALATAAHVPPARAHAHPGANSTSCASDSPAESATPARPRSHSRFATSISVARLAFGSIVDMREGDSPAVNARQRELLVLGAGHSRTGTLSTKRALEMLGYKVFHGEDLFARGLLREYGEALTSPRAMDVFVDKILALGYNATLDSPTAVFVEDFLDRFPNAKVLITKRDRAEDWAASMRVVLATLGTMMQVAPWSWLMPQRAITLAMHRFMPDTPEFRAVPCPANSPLWLVPWYRPCVVDVVPVRTVQSGDAPRVARLEDVYEAWMTRMRGVVRARGARALEFNVKEGWGPLAAFLERDPPPHEPFPRINESATMERNGRFMFFVSFTWPLVAIAIAAGAKSAIGFLAARVPVRVRVRALAAAGPQLQRHRDSRRDDGGVADVVGLPPVRL